VYALSNESRFSVVCNSFGVCGREAVQYGGKVGAGGEAGIEVAEAREVGECVAQQ
jgi:hypothetical protein